MSSTLALLISSSTALPGQAVESRAGGAAPLVTVRFPIPATGAAMEVDTDSTSKGGKKIVEGAVLGFTAGAVLGGLIVKLSDHSPRATGGDVIFSGLIYGMLGGAVGAAIAAATPEEKQRELARESRRLFDSQIATRPAVRKGVVIGALAGLAAGYLAIGLHEYRHETACDFACATTRLGGGVIAGGIVGGLIGGATAHQ